MQEVLAVALAAMHQDMNGLDQIARNLSNTATPGYKREVSAPRPFIEAMEQMSGIASGANPSPVGVLDAVSPQSLVMYDNHAGTVKTTGEAFDLALTGEGFFEVMTAQGPAYTRQGNLAVDAQGRLVTAHGDPVMGKAGEIRLTTTSPVIDGAGNITEPNALPGTSNALPGMPVGQIKVVTFDSTKTMEHLGDGLMSAGVGITLLDDVKTRVQQGALENSNVTPMQEMVQMMQTMRHAESMQKVVQGYDDLMGTAIHKLGDLS